MEITTIQKYIHTSPRKLRLVADMIRKMNPGKAFDVLQLTPKAAAKDLQKAIGTVLANAKQQGLDIQKVNFQRIEINESTKMRRFKAGTRGRAKPYKRRMSHIKIVLSDDLNVKTQPRLNRGQMSKLKTEKQKENLETREEKKGDKRIEKSAQSIVKK